MIRQRQRFAVAAALVAFGFAAPGRVMAQGVAPPDSLETALQAMVLARQPDLVARRAAAATAEARLRAAGASDAPTLGAEIEDIPDGVNLPDAGQLRVMLEREFLTGPRRAAEKALARTAHDVARARLDLAERSIGAVVLRDLAVWRGWSGVAARLAAEDSLLQEAETGLQGRFAAGEARYVDVLRLRTERLRVRSERAEALRAGQEGRRLLEGMMAHNDSVQPAFQELFDALASRTAATMAADTLPSPPSVDSLMTALGALRLGDLRVEEARGQARRVRAARRAQLIGGVGVQRFGDADRGFSVGPSLRASISLPFAVSASTRAINQAAELLVAEAAAERTVFATRLRAALLLARDRYAAALERLHVYDEALLTGARQEREAALGAYGSGELSLIELLDFERALARAETDRLRAAIDARVAYADLFTAAADLRVPRDGDSNVEVGND